MKKIKILEVFAIHKIRIMKENIQPKTIWVDLLCLSSALKIIFLFKKIHIKEIIYINTTRCFVPFLLLLKRIIKKPIIQIDWIAEGEEKIGGTSLYELIQLKLIEVLDGWIAQKRISTKVSGYCQKYKYNSLKFNEHLKVEAYPYLFRPIEMAVLSEKISGTDNSFYVLRKTPFNNLLIELLGADKIIFYTSFIAQKTAVNRSNYYYDSHFNKIYYHSRIDCISQTFIFWLRIVAATVLGAVLKKNIKDIRHDADNKYNIAAELIRSRFSFQEINDLWWFKGSSIDPDTLIGLEFLDYDSTSSKIINGLKIRRYRVILGPVFLVKFVAGIFFKSDTRRPALASGAYSWRTIAVLGYLLRALIIWDEQAWIMNQQAVYLANVELWRSVYDRLGIRMLWSMFDAADPKKIAKAQALQLLDGLHMGSHWSNYPMCRVDSQKYHDVFFTWGSHFSKLMNQRYEPLATFEVGYPLDFYFDSKRSSAQALRGRYANKFILSYQDNIVGHDLLYSYNMQFQIHKMIVNILQKYKNLVVFLKPKWRHGVETMIKDIPQLNQFIKQGRIVIFLGDTARTKAVPAEIGMASDLVVGLGLSTAAAECHFAGTISFHADFTGFKQNKFANYGEGKIVFRDICSLQNAIEEIINGKNNLRHTDYQKYYKMLDPFQDGKAYLRTGFIINRLQDAFKQGLSRREAVKKVKSEYDAFLSKNYFKKDSVNTLYPQTSILESI